MPWKTILVHLDDGVRCRERVAVAAALAARHGAHLLGLAPTGHPDATLSVYANVPDRVEFEAFTARTLQELAQARAATFERDARGAGAPSVEARVVVDEHLDAVARQGRWADLVVVGQTDRSADLPGVAWDFPQQVAFHTAGPVLVVPWAGRFTDIGRDVLVAWKDARECARALRDAEPLLARARRVVLLEILGDDTDSDGALLADVQRRLERHGIVAEARRERTDIPTGEALLSRAADMGVDALVMGAYGHTRLREWVLGGVTKLVLDHMTVPTFVAH
jgi:nucleotide-binding universal stress UspA family protein